MANRIIICVNGKTLDNHATKRMLSKFLEATDIFKPNPKVETARWFGDKITFYWFYTKRTH